MMSPNRDPPTPKKRESRAGTRKVTSLSAEQLERKRANDREAQRTIRQRTKEHIENLEHQVAELTAKYQRYDEVVRQNTTLQDEIKRLRHELAIMGGGRQAYPDPHSTYNSPSGPSLPPQLPGPLGLHPTSRTPSVLSTPSQVSLAPDWQHYSAARSPSLCESSEADYPNRVESYMFDSQLQAAPPIPSQPPPPMSVAAPLSGFNAPVPGGSRLPDPTAPTSYSQYYPTSNPHPSHVSGGGGGSGGGNGAGETGLQHHSHHASHASQSAMAYNAAPRSVPDPLPPPDKGPGEYPIFPSAQQQQYPAIARPATNPPQYSYPWYHQS